MDIDLIFATVGLGFRLHSIVFHIDLGYYDLDHGSRFLGLVCFLWGVYNG